MTVLAVVTVAYLAMCAAGALAPAGVGRFRPDGPVRVRRFPGSPDEVAGAYRYAAARSRGLRAVAWEPGTLFVEARPGPRVVAGDCGLVMRFEFTGCGTGTRVAAVASRKVAPAVLTDHYAAFARAEQQLLAGVRVAGLVEERLATPARPAGTGGS